MDLKLDEDSILQQQFLCGLQNSMTMLKASRRYVRSGD